MSDLRSDLEAVRAEIADLEAERRRVRAAPVTKHIAVERLRALLAQQAQRWRERAASAARAIVGPNFAPATTASTLGPLLNDGAGLMAAVLPNLVEAELVAAIDQELAGAQPIDDGDRGARLAELDERHLALERREEATVERVEAAGVDVDRRADASPAVVLGLAGSDAATACAGVRSG